MRELCLDARLQSVEPDAASDPTPHDNRICRPIEITPVGASVGRGFGAPRAARLVLLEMP
jgi:hypothetical protein